MSTHAERRRDGHPDYARWIVAGPQPRGALRLITPPRLGLVPAAQLYDGTRADLDVEVIARAPGHLLVRQHVLDRGEARTWDAWIPARLVRRRD